MNNHYLHRIPGLSLLIGIYLFALVAAGIFNIPIIADLV